MVPDVQATPPIVTVPMASASQYVLSLLLLARYWGRHDWVGLEWLLRAMRGQFDSERVCDRCGQKVLGWGAVQELVLCKKCILDFIEQHTITEAVHG